MPIVVKNAQRIAEKVKIEKEGVMMKKYLFLFLSVCLSLLLIACGNGGDSGNGDAGGKSSQSVKITSIVLSTNSCELTEDETYKLEYTLFPEGVKDEGLVWKSANAAVAEVDQFGIIKALSAGQTTITLSTPEGVVATCAVTVNLKPAYDRLEQHEKAFVDTCLKHINQFKNPDSLVIKAIEDNDGSWIVKYSAQNGFGGNTVSIKYLSEDSGFWDWEDLGLSLNMTITPDDSFDIDLINQAINEKR